MPAAPQSWIGIGQMSGTSLDGVDLAAVRFALNGSTWTYELLAAETLPYTPEWQDRLRSAPTSTAEDFAKLHVDYGHYLGLGIRRFALGHGLQPDFAAAHGHTTFHQPWRHFTTQIGCGETMATHLSYPLVTNFRARDVAQGGEGAPLVPFGEQALFPDAGLFLNLGGIANISLFRGRLPGADFHESTWLKPGWQYLAYDVAACNLVLNAMAQAHDPSLAYDPDGQLARSGQLLPDLRHTMDELQFYHQVPPRSLGWEYVTTEVLPRILAHPGSATDKLHTYVHHLAALLARELEAVGVRNAQIVITGGGARNTFLHEILLAQLGTLGIVVEPVTDLLTDYKEALIFAYLGLCRLLGQPNVLPGATGSRKAESCGGLHLPTGTGLWQLR